MSQDIRFEERTGTGGALGLITLNRPKALNALNKTMFLALDKQLRLWAKDDAIKAVIVRAVEGRAFCAGGDIRYVYENRQKGVDVLKQFFHTEYRLNHLIHCFPKPYIAFMDGITMGGGVGISIHGSHRIATENTVFAMPETAIGFFPDVGGSYFLSRMPDSIGMYLGLTGARLKAADCCELNITTDYVEQAKLDGLLQALAASEVKSNADVDAIITKFSSDPGAAPIKAHVKNITASFHAESVENIFDDLNSSDWGQNLLTTLKKMSPTSLKLAFQQIKRGHALEFDDCMRMEYRLVNHVLQANDFYEGIRAAVIDKDNAPIWEPENLQDVRDSSIDDYFAPLKDELHFNSVV